MASLNGTGTQTPSPNSVSAVCSAEAHCGKTGTSEGLVPPLRKKLGKAAGTKLGVPAGAPSIAGHTATNRGSEGIADLTAMVRGSFGPNAACACAAAAVV